MLHHITLSYFVFRVHQGALPCFDRSTAWTRREKSTVCHGGRWGEIGDSFSCQDLGRSCDIDEATFCVWQCIHCNSWISMVLTWFFSCKICACDCMHSIFLVAVASKDIQIIQFGVRAESGVRGRRSRRFWKSIGTSGRRWHGGGAIWPAVVTVVGGVKVFGGDLEVI